MVEQITTKINSQILENIKKLLVYSFEPINYDYSMLTKSEKELVNKEEFENIIFLIK